MTERTRSFWGWGWADRFPDRDARASIGQMAGQLLGFGEAVLRDPPEIDRVDVPPPRVGIPEALASFCTSSREARIEHTYGRSFADQVRGFEGDFRAAPDIVANPRSEEDIEAVFAWCTRERVALVPYGGGTTVAGGVEAAPTERQRGAVSLDLRAFDRVLEVDRTSLAARVQAGATGPRLESQLALHDLTLRHFPQSFEFSTVGGWIATRAGGHFATLYTHIDDKVEAVRMLTPAGVFATRRLPGSGAGPQPERLVLGSEGTLGVITEAWLRVHPRPKHRASASVHFETFEQGVEAARALAQSGLHPSNCRLLDATEATMHNVVTDGHHVLLVAFESRDHSLEPWIERALALCTQAACTHGPVIREGDEGGRDRDGGSWRDAFVNAPYMQTTLLSLGYVVDTFETACTWSAFPALHRAITEQVTAAMQRVPEIAGRRLHLTALSGGITNRNYRVDADGLRERYVIRLGGNDTHLLGISREVEHAATVSAAGVGVGAEVV
ncbi:MAG: FAD-binding oxidoreductase, partial [Deltaproteobacteria bacterium]